MSLQELSELTDKVLNVKGGVGHDYRSGAKNREPFTPQTPDPDKAPQPPRQPFANKPKPILVPKPKASFEWPPDGLWPFAETIGHHKWDGDARHATYQDHQSESHPHGVGLCRISARR